MGKRFTMKKYVIIGLILLLPAVSFGFQNEPDGFRGVKWETPFSAVKESVRFVEEDDGIKFYSKKGDSLRIGNTNVSIIKYGFYQDKFYMVQIFYEGNTNAASLKEYLFKEYGEGQEKKSVEAEAKFYGWGGYTTMILYKFYEQSKEGRVVFSSTLILRERQGKRW
jgi:hypothetical protein